MKLAQKVYSVLLANFMLFNVANANAAWTEYTVDGGINRMLSSSNVCEYRMVVKASASAASGQMFRTTYLPFTYREQWNATSASSSYNTFHFTIDRSRRFDVAPLIPVSGSFRLPSGIYVGASHNQSNYYTYASQSDERTYNCELSVTKYSTQAKEYVPSMTCVRRNSDIINLNTFVLNPATIRIQESCY